MPSEKPKKIQYTGDSKVLKAVIGIANWLLDNLYELPIASDEILGGIKVGDNLSIDENGVLSADATSIEELNDIGDVNIENPSDGQVLKYDSTSEMWTNGDASTVSDLGDLEDVNISNLSPGQILKYGGTSEGWYNDDESNVSALDDLSDVEITAPSVGDILKYGGTSVGWVNGTDSGGIEAVELTNAQYQALTAEQKNDPTKEYFVTDYPDGAIGIDDLKDTDISSPYDNQVLTYDETNEKWVNSLVQLSNLQDVYFSNLSNEQILKYNAVQQEWKNVNPNDLVSNNEYSISSSITRFSGSIYCKRYANGLKYIKVSLSKIDDFVDAQLSGGIFYTYWPVNNLRIYGKKVTSGDATDGCIVFESANGSLSVEFYDTDANSITFESYYI